jgi:hypothetical protein
MTTNTALPSWKDGATKAAILDFVARVTNEGAKTFVPPEACIAVFDNDGTLRCEKRSAVMKVRTVFVSMALAAASALVASPAAVAQGAPPPPPAVGTQPQADPWPRDVTLANASVVVYQPQVNSWTGNQLSFRVALALKPAGSSTPSYGTASGTARTVVDRGARLVDL